MRKAIVIAAAVATAVTASLALSEPTPTPAAPPQAAPSKQEGPLEPPYPCTDGTRVWRKGGCE